MDRNFDELRTEVFSLDDDTQRALVEEIEAKLAQTLNVDQCGFREAKRRMDAVERGEMKTVDGPEALARVRQLARH